MTDTFHDALVEAGTPGLPDRFFDRFMFNLHPVESSHPTVILGLGVYPPKNVVDGFVILVAPGEQRSLRFSTELSATDGVSAGPLAWRVEEPMKTWHLELGPNATGVELDVNWHARTPAWSGEVAVSNDDGTPSSFSHLFQSGYYSGTLAIDGHKQPVDGFYGQRDRSRGVRTMSGGQGLHFWCQAQFPDRSVGFLLVETRGHERLLLEGAVMHENGKLDLIQDVRHDMHFDDSLDLQGGTIEVITHSVEVYTVHADASSGGGYMAGAGYGGHHGRPKGLDHSEYQIYSLDGSVSPRTLDSALTDRPTSFTWNGTPGQGIFEFALTRSRSYTYQPTLR
ncbi:hypothetical protein ACWFR5_14185 [Streptomyces sp. NPDC055092]